MYSVKKQKEMFLSFKLLFLIILQIVNCLTTYVVFSITIFVISCKQQSYSFPSDRLNTSFYKKLATFYRQCCHAQHNLVLILKIVIIGTQSRCVRSKSVKRQFDLKRNNVTCVVRRRQVLYLKDRLGFNLLLVSDHVLIHF